MNSLFQPNNNNNNINNTRITTINTTTSLTPVFLSPHRHRLQSRSFGP
jgi:hypothetical protein